MAMREKAIAIAVEYGSNIFIERTHPGRVPFIQSPRKIEESSVSRTIGYFEELHILPSFFVSTCISRLILPAGLHFLPLPFQNQLSQYFPGIFMGIFF